MLTRSRVLVRDGGWVEKSHKKDNSVSSDDDSLGDRFEGRRQAPNRGQGLHAKRVFFQRHEIEATCQTEKEQQKVPASFSFTASYYIPHHCFVYVLLAVPVSRVRITYFRCSI